MMLEHLGWDEAADAIIKGIEERDRGQDRHLRLRAPDGRARSCSKCSEFGHAIIDEHVRIGQPCEEDRPHRRRQRSAARSRTWRAEATSATSSSSTSSKGCRRARRSTSSSRARSRASTAQIIGTNELRRHRRRRRLHRHRRRRAQARHEPRRPARRSTRRSSPTSPTNIKKHAPKAFVIVVSNPLDAMVTLMKRVTRLPEGARRRHGGRARLVALPHVRRDGARRVGESVRRSCSAATATTWCRSGAAATVGGIPVAKLIQADRLDAIEERTRKAGGEIVALLEDRLGLLLAGARGDPDGGGVSSTTRRRSCPCAALLEGEYGVTRLLRRRAGPDRRRRRREVIELELTDEREEASSPSP